MKSLLGLIVWCLALAGTLSAEEAWQRVLSEMPLETNGASLNREDCMALMLGAFQSNGVLKALIFLPAVAEDFYLINRGQPKLNLAAGNLLEAVTALTNATAVRATFRPPFLLLHLERERLEPVTKVRNKAAATRLQAECHFAHALFLDRHWENVQPWLQQQLGMKCLPPARAEAAWHFNRHNLAGWGLTDWELLTALSLAGRTSFTVSRGRITFQENLAAPHIDQFRPR